MTESHDLWEQARETTRKQVQSAFKPRPQTCPSCGVTTETSAALCPQCRSPYALKEKGFKITPKKLGIAAAFLVAIGIGIALIVPGERRNAAAQDRAARAKEAALVRAETARLTRDVRPVRVVGPVPGKREDARQYRPRLLRAGEAAVTANARLRMRQGTMDGPVRGTECDPYPATSTRTALETDVDATLLRYECIAYERHFALSELEGKARTGLIGQPFWLVANYDTGALVFCKVTPKAGEGGKSLAHVLIPVPCRDPATTSAR